MAFGLGGGKSSQSQKIDKDQKQWLERLWKGGWGGMKQARGNLMGAPGFGMGLAQQFGGQASQLYDNPFLQGLQQQAQGNPALVQQQADVLKQQIGDFSAQQMNQATNTGIGAGQFGSRGQVARGAIGSAATDAFASGYSQLQQADAQRAMQAGISGGGLLSQGILGGMSGIGGLLGTYQGAGMSPMMPYGQYAGILGSPVVLGQSSSWNASMSGGGGSLFA